MRLRKWLLEFKLIQELQDNMSTLIDELLSWDDSWEIGAEDIENEIYSEIFKIDMLLSKVKRLVDISNDIICPIEEEIKDFKDTLDSISNIKETTIKY